MEFERDSFNAGANIEKHGISFEEAAEVFADSLSLTVSDPDNSIEEDRFVIFGRTTSGTCLVVAFADRDDRIRIVSAREMTRRERKAYEQ